MSGTVELIVREAGYAVHPLALAIEDESTFAHLMRTLGWNVSGYVTSLKDLKPVLAAIGEFIEKDELTSNDVDSGLGHLAQFFVSLNTAVSAGQLPSGVNATEFRSEFPKQLRDYLLVQYLFRRNPVLGRWLRVLGVIRVVHVAATSSRMEYTRYEIAWTDLVDVLGDPGVVFRRAYHWGQTDFDGAELLKAIHALGLALNLSAHTSFLSQGELSYLTQGAGPGEKTTLHERVVRWPLVSNPYGNPPVAIGIQFAILPKTSAREQGFAILPYAHGSIATWIPLTRTLDVVIGAGFSAAGGVALRIYPNQTPELEVGFLNGAASAAVQFGAELSYADPKAVPLTILGDRAGSRLQVGSLSIRGGARARTGGSSGFAAFVEVELSSAALVIGTGSSDGFLRTILGDSATLDFNATLGLDSDHGLYFTGSAGLQIEIPCHIQLGPIEIHNAAIAIRPSAAGIPIDLTSTISANFGFLNALVENIGITANLSTPAGGGKLGPFDFTIGPRLPDGIAIGIEAGIVKGLGYFYFDREKEEYGGALELTIAELFSVKAFGLVNTRMPNGEKGFSLVVIMTFEFPDPGIQLGLGFRLLGVGGLIGIERNFELDELVQRMRSGALIRLVYPSSLEANVLTPLFDDLRAIFPVGKSTLLGPFFKLAYGTPTVVDIKLGLIFEIPGNVAIVGVINAALPKAEGAVLKLTVSFVGVVEQQRLWFFAVLYDSRLVTYALDGEIGLLVAFAGSRAMLLSAGGFHPRYNPPPLPFPTPARLALEILNRDNAKIRAESYFAVWSGGAMFGVRAECYFGYSAFDLSGDFRFDCLIRFDPFSFEVDVSASLSAEVFGVGCFSLHVGLHLEGPRPYRASGDVKIAIRCAPDIHKHIDKEWGSDGGQALPQIQIFGMVASEIDRAANWGTALPAGARPLVSLRDRDKE